MWVSCSVFGSEGKENCFLRFGAKHTRPFHQLAYLPPRLSPTWSPPPPTHLHPTTHPPPKHIHFRLRQNKTSIFKQIFHQLDCSALIFYWWRYKAKQHSLDPWVTYVCFWAREPEWRGKEGKKRKKTNFVDLLNYNFFFANPFAPKALFLFSFSFFLFCFFLPPRGIMNN